MSSNRNYMVELGDRLQKKKSYVDYGSYFVINKGRQYGKNNYASGINQHDVFAKFLALLRGAYLKKDKTPTFHSVILAGVYSIKNLKLILRPKSEHQYNSPWNIAADFDIIRPLWRRSFKPLY